MERKKNLCMITTLYSLLEYLLYASEKEINETTYIFENWIPDSITSHFENKYKLPLFNKRYQWDRKYCRIWLRYYKWRYLPNFDDYNLIAHDHLFYSSVFIGNRKYTMLEDGPRIFSQISVDKQNNMYAYRRYLRFQKIRKLLFGPIDGYLFGTHPQCTDLIVTSMDIADQLKGKNIHYFNLFEAWKNASNEKKQFILKVFGISEQLIQQIGDRDIVYFTDSFCNDGVLSLDEYRDLNRRILSKYDTERMVIKPHPRDFNSFYQEDFPNVIVLPSFVPSQLLDMIGLRFKKAVTVISSSVFNMDYPIEVDWYGLKVHPKIVKAYREGENVPEGVNRCTLD